MKALKFIAIIAIAAVSLSLSSCRKVSHNGKLDGLWQIRTIEDLSTGEISTPEPLEYIAFDLHIMQLQCGGPLYTAEMVYDKEGATIHADFPYIKETDIPSTIGRFGITDNPVDISITTLSRSTLILRTPSSIITLRKF